MGLSKGDDRDMNWAAKLTELDSTRGDKPPGDGWERMEEIIRESPFGHVKTRKLIDNALQAGTYEVYAGTEVGNKGLLVRRVWYRKRDH